MPCFEVLFLSATLSPTLYLQMAGRGSPLPRGSVGVEAAALAAVAAQQQGGGDVGGGGIGTVSSVTVEQVTVSNTQHPPDTVSPDPVQRTASAFLFLGS